MILDNWLTELAFNVVFFDEIHYFDEHSFVICLGFGICL